MRGNNNKIVRKANRYLILDTIRSYDHITQEELVRKTRLSYPTVRNLVIEMLNEGIVKKEGFAESTGGRQPALLKLNSTAFFSMGLDIAGSCVRLVISDLKGNIIFSKMENFDTQASKKQVLEYFAAMCSGAIEETNIPKEKIIGLGVGIPGIIDTQKNVSVFVERITEWRGDVDVVAVLEEKLGIKVLIRNDVHLLGLIEKYLYVKNEVKNFVYIALRNGIGMAIFINGELFEGNMGNAGYIGHMKIDLEGNECVCGKRGCLETFVNSQYLLDEYLLLKGGSETRENIEIKESKYIEFFVNRAKKEDEEAKTILDKAGFALGIGIANVIKILDFSHIIIGGLPDGSDNLFMPSIKDAIRNNINDHIMNEVKIKYGKLSYDAAALGGCFLAIEDFFMEPKLKLSE